MIEVRCNGKTYKFEESSEIVDQLDMQAVEVTDDPDQPACAPRQKAYTRDTAALILEKFEDLLTAKDMRVPCADPDEQAELNGDPDNDARLYGTEYSDLLDEVEADIAELADKIQAGAAVVKDEFSGTM